MTKLERLQHVAREAGLEWVMVSEAINVRWLTGFTGSFGYAIVRAEPKDGNNGFFVTDSRYTIQAKQQVQDLETLWFASPVRLDGFLADLFAEHKIGKLGFESTVSFATHEAWKAKFGGTQLVPLGSKVTDLRMIKSEEEVQKIHEACKLTDACFERLTQLIQPGMTEFDLQLELEFFIRRHRAELAFEPIVVSGANSARPHGKATDKPLESGDFLTLDFGAKVDGYCADLTRTVVVGKSTDRHEEIYNQVLKAQLAAIDAIKPGAHGKDIDALAREVLNQNDLARFFGHGLGHGLGVYVHDPGSLSTASTTVLEPMMVFTVEPGVYIGGFGGVRIEDDVVVRHEGPQILNSSPKELLVLP